MNKLVVTVFVLLLATAHSVSAMGLQMSGQFADPKKRMKNILVLPLHKDTFSVQLDDDIELMEGLTAEYGDQLFETITSDLQKKGYNLVFMEAETTSDQQLMEQMADEILDVVKTQYPKERKGVRYNWYGVLQGVVDLRDRYKVDGIAFQHVGGGYKATKPSKNQLAKSVAVDLALGAIFKSGAGLGGVKSNSVYKDNISGYFVLIDTVSGKFDLVSEAVTSYSVTMKTKKNGEPDLRNAKKQWTKALSKVTKRVPPVGKKIKIQLVPELYEIRPRKPLVNDINEELLEDIEDLLAE